jgi:hypothetical protein
MGLVWVAFLRPFLALEDDMKENLDALPGMGYENGGLYH